MSSQPGRGAGRPPAQTRPGQRRPSSQHGDAEETGACPDPGRPREAQLSIMPPSDRGEGLHSPAASGALCRLPPWPDLVMPPRRAGFARELALGDVRTRLCFTIIMGDVHVFIPESDALRAFITFICPGHFYTRLPFLFESNKGNHLFSVSDLWCL